MKTTSLISIAVILVAAVFLTQNRARTEETRPRGHYEYASVRFMGGDKVVVVWPSGKVEPLSSLHTTKRPDIADQRLYYFTVALNLLSQQGFEPATIPSVEPKPDDLFLRRPVP